MPEYSSENRVLITGGTGFIGRHLRGFLHSKGYDVHYISRLPTHLGVGQPHVCDLVREDALSELFSEIRPNYLLHLASLAVPNRNLAELNQHYENTVLPTLTLAHIAPAYLKLAVFFGSCEEYGAGTAPFQEHHPLHAVSPYGWAKISAFHGSKLIAQQRNFPWCWIRPFLCFGAEQHSDSIIPTLIRGCINNEAILLTPGEQTRDFIYVLDLCEMLLTMMQHPQISQGQTLNLASGIPRTILSVARSINKIVGGGTLKFGAKPYRQNEIMSFYGSTSKFTACFGDRQHHSFEEALVATIKAFQFK